MKRGLYGWLTIYLRLLARLQLLKQKRVIIGVTGSVGKTSTIMAIKAVLQNDYKVKVSNKANSEVGIPLDILGFKVRSYAWFEWIWILPIAFLKVLTNFSKYDIYVVEMGIDSPRPPKNMEWLLSIIKPKIGVFLNVQPVHSEAFENLKEGPLNAIALEKGKLITSLPRDGWALLNAKDKRVKKFENKTKAKVIAMNGCDQKTVAMAMAKVFEIKRERALKSFLKNYKSATGRMTIIKGIKGTTLIDSSYNASRESMMMGLKTLNNNTPPHTGTVPAGVGKRRVAVLGDMRELGSLAKKEHELVAEKVVKVAQVIVIVGPLMKKYLAPKVVDLGFDKKNLFIFDNTYEAALKLRDKIVKNGDRILIKASQNTLLFEIITETLMMDKNQADNLLCRRGKFWNKKRAVIKKKTATI